MRARLLKIWDRIRTSFWFVPSVMAVAAVALAFATVAIDEAIGEKWIKENSLAYSGGAEGASIVLGTIAGSMVTIAGVVFSMTLVTLSLASSQFGPRLLRNFMRDTSNQIVLGTFIATFLYCLIVLRTIRRDDFGDFVPHVSVTISALFALASLGVLIYFIHHVSISIHASEVVARVAAELMGEIDQLFPEQIGEAKPGASDSPQAKPALPTGEAATVTSKEDGYLEIIDAKTLMSVAVATDAVVRVEQQPGHYIIAGQPLVTAWPGQRVNDEFIEQVRSAFVLGSQRTAAQDVAFSVNQLVEVAVRSLSTGINDPFTAVSCVDRIGSALSRLAQRETPSPYRFDETNRLRVIAPPVTFAALAEAALTPIRHHAARSLMVTIRLLERIAVVVHAARREDDRAVLRRHADMIVRGARESLTEEEDRKAVERAYESVTEALTSPARLADR